MANFHHNPHSNSHQGLAFSYNPKGSDVYPVAASIFAKGRGSGGAVSGVSFPHRNNADTTIEGGDGGGGGGESGNGYLMSDDEHKPHTFTPFIGSRMYLFYN